ncbi:MAG TPA: cytochrome c oxidase assembly protein [Ktedonobacterales bacterium]
MHILTITLMAALATSQLPRLALLLEWNLDPTLVLGIAGLIVGYFYAIGPLRRRLSLGPPATDRQIAAFLAGTVTLALALMSPLDTLGDRYLFSAHMVQHMLLVVAVPPLALLGTPGWLFSPLLRHRAVLFVGRALTNPFVAFFLLNGALYIWHIPSLYDATLSNEMLHIAEHLIFLATGVLFWWPVIGPANELPRLSRPLAVIYLFLACQPMVLLGALLTFAAQPFYLPYVAAPRIFGSTPLGDQQLGGLIMWLPTNIPYLIALSVLFFQWVGERDMAEQRAAEELARAEDESLLRTHPGE